MDKLKSVVEWRNEIELVLEIKVKEFHMLGYDKATNDDVWNCLLTNVWKKKSPEKRLYEVVSDVLCLQSTTYMTYLTMGIYQEDDDLMASIAALSGN